MAHFSRVAKVVVDVPAADHDGELGFWSAATGTQLNRFERAPEYHGGDLGSPDMWLLVHSWWVMRDPAGLPFCVIPQASGLDESNARRWD